MEIRLITIPNLLTLSNLLCGALGAVMALAYGDLTAAFCLMVAAAVFDFLDGFVARLLGQSSPIGLQLDSLADDVTFGFTPAAILFALYGRAGGALWMGDAAWPAFLVFFFTACAALRLAKFNIDDTQRTEFCGLPSPAAALFCASLGLVAERYCVPVPREGVLAAALVAGLLMLAPVRMFALKFHGFGWRGNELRYSFLLLSGVLIGVLRLYAIPAIVGAYVLVSTVRWLRRRPRNEAR